jgi:ABC-type multidrug transport system fused ATPase/permease subunit
VIGTTGAGKTTLAKLIARLEEPGRGSVMFDGVVASAYELNSYRRRLSVVWQDSPLLRRTIRQNLALGEQDVVDARLHEVLEVCQLSSFVKSLPLGLDTPIGELGATVSAGQRQRFSLARALVRQADVYLFDEATSGLDQRTEAALIPALLRYLSGRTVVLITHRLHWLGQVDNVCLLDAGRVAAFGPHEALLSSSKEYRFFLSGSEAESDRGISDNNSAVPG